MSHFSKFLYMVHYVNGPTIKAPTDAQDNIKEYVYNELQKCCNIWQFWIACDVALYSIGITLSIVEMK